MSDDTTNGATDGRPRHGVVAVASDPWRAFEHIERLEHICQMVLASGVRPSQTRLPDTQPLRQEAA